jgi:Flp pilus assembly protein TadG
VIPTADERRADRGSAPVDFVLVGSLLTLLFLAVLQVGIDLYVRNVLAACAADGARYAANADVADPAAAAARADELIRTSVGDRFAHAAGTLTTVAGRPAITVTVAARLPLLAWFLPAGPTVRVSGHALEEPQQ